MINYLMSGAAHMPYLVASLHTLRGSGYTGPINIHCWPESYDTGLLVAQDQRLGVTEIRKREPAYRGKNSQFIDKIRLLQQAREPTLYLDADTTVHGSLEPLFTRLRHASFVCCQFNDWTTQGGLIRGRLERMYGVEEIPDSLLDAYLLSPRPSVNGGVIGVQAGCPVLETWHDWSYAARDIFISDECVLHLMAKKFPSLVHIEMGGAFNCSPKYQPKNLPDDEVVIRHYHGDSNLRPNKSPKGIGIWVPIFNECCELNLGGIADWWSKVDNKYLNAYAKEHS